MSPTDLYTLYDSHKRLGVDRHNVLARILKSYFDQILVLGLELPDQFDFYETILTEIISHKDVSAYDFQFDKVKNIARAWSGDIPDRQVVWKFSFALDMLLESYEGRESLRIQIFHTLGYIANLLMDTTGRTMNDIYAIQLNEQGFSVAYHMMKDLFDEYR